MPSRFHFRHGKSRKLSVKKHKTTTTTTPQLEQQQDEKQLFHDYDEIQPPTDTTIKLTRTRTNSRKKRSTFMKLSRKHYFKKHGTTKSVSSSIMSNQQQQQTVSSSSSPPSVQLPIQTQTTLVPIMNSQQLTNLALNSLQASMNSNSNNNNAAATNHVNIANLNHHHQQQQQLPVPSSILNTSISSNALPTQSQISANNCPGTMSGYLSKWTNYLKGYQKRWFNLSNGLLSYYRSQTEMAHSCRGTINLANAVISSEDACHFVVSNGVAQIFHLKAANEADKQKWVAALELAKNRAKQDNPDSDDETNTEAEKNEVQTMLKTLAVKLEDLNTCHDLVQKHSGALTKSLIDLEALQSRPDESTLKTINERATLFKITLLAMINACQEFTTLANTQGRKMQKVLQSEHDMRIKFEEMVQEMARAQSNFETQISKRSKRKDGTLSSNNSISLSQQQLQSQQGNRPVSEKHDLTQAACSDAHTYTKKTLFELNEDEDDDDDGGNNNDDEFHDALEDVCVFPITMPKVPGKISHRRNLSSLSKLSLQESEPSSGDEDEQNNKTSTTIQVTMHTNKDQQEPQQEKAVALKTPQQIKVRQRRKEIPPRPNYSLNLWGIMKNCIGKDLSKIPIPVNFSEPISMLQRMIEEMEYSELLDRAAACDDQWEQLAYVAAFTISSYSTTATRTNKPFNPLLGETFECDRIDEAFGWRALAEQVSHHPPGLSVHVESIRDWTMYQEFMMSSKFRGQYLQIVPLGTSHLEFKKTGNHYTWRKIQTFVRNIIVGKLWIDNVGEMDIINHKTKDVCHLKYFPYSYFSRDPPRKVTGIITDSNNVARYVLNGTWTEQIEGAPVLNPQVVTEQTQLNTGTSKILWKRKYPPPHLESMYNFTELAVQLNEAEDGVAPTDSRNRPDQRLMEQALWDEANKEKVRLEDKQRTIRKQRELMNEQLAAENKPQVEYESLWFKKTIDPYTNQPVHIFKNEYWECKKKQDWKRCPDLY